MSIHLQAYIHICIIKDIISIIYVNENWKDLWQNSRMINQINVEISSIYQVATRCRLIRVIFADIDFLICNLLSLTSTLFVCFDVIQSLEGAPLAQSNLIFKSVGCFPLAQICWVLLQSNALTNWAKIAGRSIRVVGRRIYAMSPWHCTYPTSFHQPHN